MCAKSSGRTQTCVGYVSNFTGRLTLEIDLEEGEIVDGMKGERQTHPE